MSAPRRQMSPSESASGAVPPPNAPLHAGERGEGARLTALRGGACQSDRTLQLSPGRASREGEGAALPAPSIALKRSTPHPGRSAGGDDARAARERGYEPRPQEPHPLHHRPSPVTSLERAGIVLVS
jgi:hypothetical protein